MKRSKPAMTVEGLVAEYKSASAALVQRVTPTADVFVLAHMGIPEVALSDWSIEIDGLVECPIEITYEDLSRRPKRTLESVHKCAGNPLNPTVPTRPLS